MVDKANEEGAYAEGGYNPNAVYNNNTANAAIASFGDIVGDALTKIKPKAEKEEEKFDTADAEKARDEYEKIQKDKEAKESTNSLNKQLGNLWKR
jgi:hypothetical protein